MTPRRKYSFYIDDAQAEALKRIKERDGVLESEQIRRAIDAWIHRRGTVVKERGARTRKRAERP
jgi:hypothetical protein